MTKKVRIEDADTSTHKVVVEVWAIGNDGMPDVKTAEYNLFGPCDMKELYIHRQQYLIVRETE